MDWKLMLFNVDEVRILKGPSSLLYGSDAMGGVIEILPLLPQKETDFLVRLPYWENQ